MELSKTEAALVAIVEAERMTRDLAVLTESQLAVIGGGIGDVVLG